MFKNYLKLHILIEKKTIFHQKRKICSFAVCQSQLLPMELTLIDAPLTTDISLQSDLQMQLLQARLFFADCNGWMDMCVNLRVSFAVWLELCILRNAHYVCENNNL